MSPVYNFKCIECGHEQYFFTCGCIEDYFQACPKCGALMERQDPASEYDWNWTEVKNDEPRGTDAE
jgi:transcription initiation factor IIE alpha subunit